VSLRDENRRWREREHERRLIERDAAPDRYDAAYDAWHRAERKGPEPPWPSW
jgi:hypothetical protein